MSVNTTEITSSELLCENPIHQRLLQAYYLAIPYIKGSLLELGCGQGRGIEVLYPYVEKYYAIDKIEDVIEKLKEKYKKINFLQGHFPPLSMYDSDTFDTIVGFQVIEHIKDDNSFVKEIYRLLKPDGQAIITTPNRLMTLSRNPWHVREYTKFELECLLSTYFKSVKVYAINGSEKVMTYHSQNKKSVNRIMQFDVFNLQYLLPAWMLKKPYEFLNKRNRNKLLSKNDSLVSEIDKSDYQIGKYKETTLDLFAHVVK